MALAKGFTSLVTIRHHMVLVFYCEQERWLTALIMDVTNLEFTQGQALENATIESTIVVSSWYEKDCAKQQTWRHKTTFQRTTLHSTLSNQLKPHGDMV